MNVTTSALLTKPTRARRMLRVAGKLLGTAGLVVVAIIAYLICIDVFGGYPQVHSFLLSTIAMILISLTGAAAWVIDERRPHDDVD